MEYIQIGTAINTFGLKGEIKILSNSEFIEDRFAIGKKIWIFKNEVYSPYIIDGFRIHNKSILIRLEGLHDINDILHIKGSEVFSHIDDIKPLEEGYYLFQLQGLSVFHDNLEIGIVSESLKPAGQTLLKVKTAEKFVLIPFVPAFIKNVDLEKKRIDILVIEGLL